VIIVFEQSRGMEVCSLRRIALEHRIPMDNIEDARETADNGVVWLLFGLVLLVAGGWIGWRFHSAWYTWPSVDASVVGGGVEEFHQYPTARGGRAILRFRSRIEFRYTLYRKEYITKAWLDSPADSYQEAPEGLLATYAPGTHHAIRCNPQDPTDIRFGSPDFSALALSLLLLGIGLLICASGVRTFARAYSRRPVSAAPSWFQRAKAAGVVLGFPFRSSASSGGAATIRCPGCGESVEADQSICPKCSRSLRAA
jgi:hypothetical protein